MAHKISWQDLYVFKKHNEILIANATNGEEIKSFYITVGGEHLIYKNKSLLYKGYIEEEAIQAYNNITI